MEHRCATIERCDYLVIGSGIAGLYFALEAAEHGTVVILTKRDAAQSSTWHAQGGIAAVLDPQDSYEAHIRDTLRVGVGLCDVAAVTAAVTEGPDCVRDLAARFSVVFDQKNGGFDLGREGGHGCRRVAHAHDMTGREVASKLLDAVHDHPRITLMEDCMAVDLLTAAKYGGPNACFGAFVLDRHSGRIGTLLARATILATGGTGKVYLYTSNPDTASGDGIAMAYRVGASVANLEFIQFHPTCLYHPEARSFLISEALRGEGGKLRLADGTRFMPSYHDMAELAPRDVVARAIDQELKRTGDDCVYLDMTALDPEFLRQRFPNIYKTCLSFGIDLTCDPIPVVPAAHYSCGGVKTDLVGRTDVQNLFAIGEVACTGLHGACRLASNSLLEGLVFAKRTASVVKDLEEVEPPGLVQWGFEGAADSDEAVVVTHNWDEIRRFMWNYVGIVRTTKRLERARRRIETVREEIRDYYWNFKITADLLELRNLALTAHLIILSAMARPESRGLHFMLDYPETMDWFAKDTVLRRGSGPPA